MQNVVRIYFKGESLIRKRLRTLSGNVLVRRLHCRGSSSVEFFMASTNRCYLFMYRRSFPDYWQVSLNVLVAKLHNSAPYLPRALSRFVLGSLEDSPAGE